MKIEFELKDDIVEKLAKAVRKECEVVVPISYITNILKTDVTLAAILSGCEIEADTFVVEEVLENISNTITGESYPFYKEQEKGKFIEAAKALNWEIIKNEN